MLKDKNLAYLLRDLPLASVSGVSKHGSKIKQLPSLSMRVVPVCCFLFQDVSSCASGAVAPSRRCESCLGTPR